MPSFRKEMNEDNGDYEHTEIWKPFFNHSERKECPNFWVISRPWLTSIQACPSAYQTCAFGNFHRRWERANFIKYAPKLLNKPKHSVRSDMPCFGPGLIMNSQNNGWLDLSLQDVTVEMKTHLLVHITVFEIVTSDGDVIRPLIFARGLSFNT